MPFDICVWSGVPRYRQKNRREPEKSGFHRLTDPWRRHFSDKPKRTGTENAFRLRMKKRAKSQRRILVVDDEPLVCLALQILLAAEGHFIDVAKSGDEALAMFEPGKFDMVFTDYLMPGMKGDQLAAAIKRRSPEQPVVMLTSYPEKLQGSGYPRGGVDSLICKPIIVEYLRSALAQFAPG